MKKCAYCDKTFDKLTDEHVVSRSFMTAVFPRGSGYSQYYHKLSSNYQKINDVCSKCNNEVLKRYDDYFIEFYRRIDQSQPIKKGTRMNIEYDFDLLSRWLLKTLYNSERKNGYPEFIHKMRMFRNYIIGKDNRSRLFNIYIELLADVALDEAKSRFPNLIANGVVKLPFLKIGNCLVGDPAKVDRNYIIKYFLTENIVFYIHIVNKRRCPHSIADAKMENFVDENGKLLIKRLDPQQNIVNIKSSGRTVVDIIGDTIEGDMTSLKRYLKEIIE